jgi:hypothetical protein
MISETLSFGAFMTRMLAREYFGEFVLRGFSFNDPTASTASLSKVCVCVCVCVCVVVSQSSHLHSVYLYR